MLLQLILVLTAIAANALVMPSNITTGLVQSLHERTPLPPHNRNLHIPNTDNARNTYSPVEMEHFLKSHLEALEMCGMVIDEAMVKTGQNKGRFDRIFRRWFAQDDRKKVIDVFMSMFDYDGGMQGHPNLDNVQLVDDYSDAEAPTGNCNLAADDGLHSDAVAINSDQRPGRVDELILCPRFFATRVNPQKHGVSGENEGKTHLDCQKIGNRLEGNMMTAGSSLVHEYTHFNDITHRMNVIDHAEGYALKGASGLDKDKATTNADSYAWLATEIMWSVVCERDFIYPR